jgi:hypothetical protein
MKRAWQVWLLAALMFLSLLGSLPALFHPNAVQVQVFDWWGRGSLVAVLNMVSSGLLLLALVALFARQSWGLSAVLAGVWVPNIFRWIYVGIIFNNLDDYKALVMKTATSGAANNPQLNMIATQFMHYAFLGAFGVGVALSLVWAAGLTGLAVWKRGEIQGLE